MKPKALPTFTKLLVTWFGPMIAALFAVVLVAGSQQVFGDEIKDFEKTTKELKEAGNDKDVSKIAKDATDTIDKANEEAKENVPGDKAKTGADRWDEKGRATDDDPTAKAKNEAEEGAKSLAEKYAKADEDPEKAGNYIKALKKRRDARKILKAAIAKLEEFKRAAAAGAYTQGLVGPLKIKIDELKKKLKDAEKTISMGPTVPKGEEFAGLLAAGKIKVETTGTGETIGHIADLQIQNLTDHPISFMVRPMILESGSGKNQHYACPRGESVALDPHQKKTVPMNGVCLVRNKPPVGKGVTGDLLINEGTPDGPQNPDSHLPKKDAHTLLRIATSKYDAADKLQQDGALKDIPYTDKQKQKDIVVQWSTWSDPRISEITGAPPATKDDLKKIVYKQVEEHGPVTPEKKKKIDEGIDTIFEKVELTTEKAKDLEKPESSSNPDSTGEDGKGENSPPPINVSDNTPTPAPAVPPTTDAKPTPLSEKEPPVDTDKDDKAKQAWKKEAPLIDQEIDPTKTTTEKLPHGGERKVYKNRDGQRILERDYDEFAGTAKRVKKILRYHKNGKEAEVIEEIRNGSDNIEKTTLTQTSQDGLPSSIEVEDLKKGRKTIQTWPPGSGKEGVTKVFRRKDKPVMAGPEEWEPVDPKDQREGSKGGRRAKP